MESSLYAFISDVARRQADGEIGKPSGAATDEYPYSPLQHGGFFILFFFPAIALIVVGLRVYGRVRSRQFGWDDGLACVAMMFSIAETGCSYMAMRTAFLGVHVYDIPRTADVSLGMYWNYVIQILYNPILALVKCSVLTFLLRIGGQRRQIRYSIHALNIFTIGLMIAIFVTVIFQCSPISYFWERITKPTMQGKCIDTGIFYVTTAALTIFTDVLVLALPFWIFMGLKMAPKVKFAIMVVFLLGAVVTVVSVLRMLWIIETSLYQMKFDYSYDIRFTYSAVETNLAIITASGPALRPLFMVWFPRFFSSLRGTGNQNYRYRDEPYALNGTGNANKSGGNGNSSKGEHLYGTSSFALRDMKGRTEIRSHSPTTSEEEIMTYNGIVRTTEVEIEFVARPQSSHQAK
uniref:Decarboxylase_GME3443 n=1 Tax=Daldinia eschscholzii IFB-TL01 TaxID=1169046 RepID=A0A0X9IHB0_9PEZI|nr:decarboxylase_GME3443 [Daldinia eschscholzii IFB-TL01]